MYRRQTDGTMDTQGRTGLTGELTQRQIHRQTDRQTNIWRKTEWNNRKERKIETRPETYIDRMTDARLRYKQTGRQTDRQTNRQTGRQIGRFWPKFQFTSLWWRIFVSFILLTFFDKLMCYWRTLLHLHSILKLINNSWVYHSIRRAEWRHVSELKIPWKYWAVN